MPGDIDEKLAAVDESLSAASGEDDRVESRDRAGDDGVPWSGSESVGGAGGGPLDDDGRSVDGDGGSVDGDGWPVDAEGSVAADVAALTERVAELEAAVQALRGYAGSVRAVNDRVEERADAAVATTESLRERVAALEGAAGGPDRETDSRGARDRRTRGERRAREASRWEGSDRDRPDGRDPDGREGADRGRGAGGCARCGGVGEPDEAPGPRAGGGEGAGGGDARSAPGADGEPVSWPPAEPREAYGEVDADADRERPGLVARLRDAL